jgi:hypothetical protein
MNTYNIIIFTIFGIIGYLMIIDPNVAAFVVLVSKLIKINIERLIWRIRFHPFWFTNKFAQWRMMRKYEKLAEQLNGPKDETDSSS